MSAFQYKQLVFDVRKFGADPLGASDSGVAIQAALDAASYAITTGNQNGAVVYLPAGNYLCFSPLRLNSSRVKLKGDGRKITITKWAFSGPVLTVANSLIVVPTTAGITTSGGVSFSFAAGDLTTGHYSLRDHQGGEIDGLPTLTAEMFVRPTALLSNTNLMSSGAFRLSGEAYTSTLNMLYLADGSVAASLRTTSGTASLSAPPGSIQVGVRKHVAMSWDGTTIRLFIEGIQQSSAALSGTIIQEPFQDFVIGQVPQFWPQTGALTSPPTGALDAVRLSDSGLYTSNFTAPTTKLSQTSNTRLLLNLTAQAGPLTAVQSKFGNGHILFHPYNALPDGISELAVEGIMFTAATTGISVGPFGMSVRQAHFNDIEIQGFRQGLSLFDNSFEDEIHDYRAQIQDHGTVGKGARFGFLTCGAAGITRCDRFHVTGGAYPFFMGDSSSGTLSHIFVEGGVTTLWGFVLNGVGGGSDSYGVNGLLVNNEAGAPIMEYAIVIANNHSVAINGATIYLFGAFTIPVLIHGGQSTVISAPSFRVGPITELIHVSLAPDNPVVLINPDNSSSNPYSLTAGSIRLAAPQDLETISSPSFYGLTLSQPGGSPGLFRTGTGGSDKWELQSRDTGGSSWQALLRGLAGSIPALELVAVLEGVRGSGSNAVGLHAKQAGGRGTGTGAAGLSVVQFPLKTSSGSAVQVLSTGIYPVIVNMHNQVSNVTIQNTVTETSMLTTGVTPSTDTIEAGMDRVGRRFLIRASGDISFTGTPTLTIRLKLGGSAIATLVATLAANDGGRWDMDAVYTIQVGGATGTMTVDSGNFRYYNTVASISTPRIAPGIGSLGSVAFTSSKQIQATAQWSAADALNIFQIYSLMIDMVQ